MRRCIQQWMGERYRRILSVSTNTRLRITRDDTLAVYGFTVLSPRHPIDAPHLVAQEGIEAIVIGHSVEPQERKRVIPTIRNACPTCPVVFVYIRPEEPDEPLADQQIDITDGLLVLIESLERLIASKDRKSA